MQHSAAIFPESYASFFAPRTHKFDTVDFRVPHTPYNLRTLFPRSSRQRLNNGRIAGLLGLLVGLIVAIIGFAVDQLQRGLTIGLYTATQRLYSKSLWPAFLVFLLLSLIFVLVPTILVVCVAPLGAGSGIPELKSYLNGVRYPGFLAFNSLVVKVVGIAFSIASGLICGKQGPMIHAGAIVGAGISQAASTTFRYRLPANRLTFLRTEQWKRDFTAIGAAVGVAVAFGSPMGAWMWVYEEACTHWTWEIGFITLGGCISGAIIARILNFLASGLPAGFGAFTLTQFGKLVTPFQGTSFPLKDIPAYVFLGVLGGVAGALLPMINRLITLFRYRHITKPIPRVFETLLITLLTAIVRLALPYFANDCRSVEPSLKSVLEQAPLSDFSRFNCNQDEYSPWAAVIYNPTDSVVRSLLFVPASGVLPSAAIGTALVFYFIFIVWTYGIAVPAGIFFPGFLLGAVYGRLVGEAVQAIFPQRSDVSLAGYAFLGAVSALAGITRTISVAVIALEATGGNDASFASVFVAVVAKFVGDFLYSRGIYDLHIDLKGIPFLEAKVPQLEKYNRLRVSDVMQSSIVGVRRLSLVSELINMMGTNEHHAFPVFRKVSGGHPKPQDADNITDMKDAGASNNSTSIQLSDSETRQPRLSIVGPQTSTSILTPTNSGMQATIYDHGQKRVMWLHHLGSKVVTVSGDSESTDEHRESERVPVQDKENEPLDYQLMGTIDRSTLLALLRHECDKRNEEQRGEDVNEAVSRDEMDTAWPNTSRVMANEEETLIKRVMDADIPNTVLDLHDYVDPDPLLISHRAPSVSAYRVFRRSGARHVLVVDMRSGRVCGIVTRKDVLPNSISDVLEKNGLEEVKVE